MRIAVTGKSGQLTRALQRAGGNGLSVIPLGRPDMELETPASIAPALAAAKPDVIINAAAYTAVDLAESEPERCMAINAVAAGVVAQAARSLGVPVIQISTDYVFDGSGGAPRDETAAVSPLNVYGRSKLAGEKAVAEATPDHVLIRTSWVYDAAGKNFVRTMLRLASERDVVRVVGDQIGGPSLADDLAAALLAIARRMVAEPRNGALRGIFNMAGGGVCSWAEFATEIFRQSARLGGPFASVTPITTAEYPTPARRPANSRLDCTRLKHAYGIALPAWQDGLARCLTEVARMEGWRAP